MSITVEDHVAIRARADELLCVVPDGLVMLPENLVSSSPGEDLRFGSESSTFRKLLHERGLRAERVDVDQDRTRFVHNRSHDWAVPAVFVATELLKSNPDIISIMIDVVRDHVKELFGTSADERSVLLEVVVENRKGRCRKVRYEGPPDGLKDVERIVRSLR